MAKANASNYTTTQFAYAQADGDQFDRTDVSTLAQAVDGHDHSSGKGIQIPTGGIADTAVTAAKLASDAVTTAKILDANVTAAKLGSDAVTTAKILDANVTAAKLASDAVTTAKILDANVTTAKIADSAVTTAKINDGAVTAAKLANPPTATLIEEQVLTETALTVTFSNIPQTYRHLILVMYARAQGPSGTWSETCARFNEDTAANYYWQRLLTYAATSTQYESIGDSAVPVGAVPSVDATAGLFGSFVAHIGHYTNSASLKVVHATGIAPESLVSAGINTLQYAGVWNSTAAITRIDVSKMPGETSDKLFVAGSIFSLYGMG